MKMRWLFALLLMVFALPGCQESPREIEVSGEAQRTTYHIKMVLDNTSPSLEEIRRQISASLAEIDAQMSNYRIGMSLLEVDAVNQRIRKKNPKLKIDLSSITQGYSVGVVARNLEALGIRNYLVEIGGEMMVKGRKTNGNDWRVAVQTPTLLTQEIQKIIDVREQGGTAIMTAGTYQHFFKENGQTYSHILNPKTGRPVTHHLRSVTVMHDDPTWAGAWDTALLCVGEMEATRIAEVEKLKVMLIYDVDGKLTEHMSKDFSAMR